MSDIARRHTKTGERENGRIVSRRAATGGWTSYTPVNAGR